ncbi:hypothetical protein FACS1894202_14780 [Clostridia bacterium]|nr:hypothetical protein FACS1894202_14780 [Clostridia bacterium]
MTMLDCAKEDLSAAKVLRTHDEHAVRICAYHIQQCVEKCLKYIIALNGVKFPHSRDVGELYNEASKFGRFIPTEVYDSMDTLTLWESKTRYPQTSFSVNAKKVDMLIQACEGWITRLTQDIPEPVAAPATFKPNIASEDEIQAKLREIGL